MTEPQRPRGRPPRGNRRGVRRVRRVRRGMRPGGRPPRAPQTELSSSDTSTIFRNVALLKRDYTRLKRDFRELQNGFVEELKEMSDNVKEHVLYTLTHIPITQKENETIWSIISNIESFRTDAHYIKGEVEGMKKLFEVDLPQEMESVISVMKNILMMQQSDFDRQKQAFQKERDEGLRSKIELKGYFFKQGKMRKSWKRRFFYFKRNLTFSYYAEKNMKKCMDTVDCSQGFKVTIDPDCYDDFCLRIKTKDRVYKLLVGNEAILNNWKKDLKIWFRLNSKKSSGTSSLNELLTKNVK